LSIIDVEKIKSNFHDLNVLDKIDDIDSQYKQVLKNKDEI
jgi:hypothetical protein